MFPVADGHCDYLYGAVQSGYDLIRPKREQAIRLDDLLQGGVALQFFACWIDTALAAPALHQCLAMIDAYERMMKSHSALVPLTRDFQPECGKIATVLSVEGGEAVDGSMAILRVLYRLGRARDDADHGTRTTSSRAPRWAAATKGSARLDATS